MHGCGVTTDGKISDYMKATIEELPVNVQPEQKTFWKKLVHDKNVG